MANPWKQAAEAARAITAKIELRRRIEREAGAAELGEDPEQIKPDPQWCPVTWTEAPDGEEHTCSLEPEIPHPIHLCDCGASHATGLVFPGQPPRFHPPSSAEHWPGWALDKIRDAVAEDLPEELDDMPSELAEAKGEAAELMEAVTQLHREKREQAEKHAAELAGARDDTRQAEKAADQYRAEREDWRKKARAEQAILIERTAERDALRKQLAQAQAKIAPFAAAAAWLTQLAADGPDLRVNAHKKAAHEAQELADHPSLEELADVAICLVGTALRHGWLSDAVVNAVAAKVAVNAARVWDEQPDGTWQHRAALGDHPEPEQRDYGMSNGHRITCPQSWLNSTRPCNCDQSSGVAVPRAPCGR